MRAPRNVREYVTSKLQPLIKSENSESGTTYLMKENPPVQTLINPDITMSTIVTLIENPHQTPKKKWLQQIYQPNSNHSAATLSQS